MFFVHFLEYLLLYLDDNVDEESEDISNSRSLASGFWLAFAWFFDNFSLALLIKVLLIKKACRPEKFPFIENNWTVLAVRQSIN